MKRIEAIAAPVREQAVAVLRDAITSGQFAPGQRLIEKELCDTLGVSRGSVREALRQLEAEQLIQNVPNRGPIVAKLSARDVLDLYQVRTALEGLTIKLFVVNADATHMTRLDEALAELTRAFETADVDLTLAAKNKFYEVFYEGSGNSMVPTLLRSLDARINLVRRLVFASGESSGAALEQFQNLVAALKRRDEDAAAQICESLLAAAVVAATAMLPKSATA